MTISEDSPDYKKRFIILPEGVATQLYNWHGGQWSGVYSLASTGDHDLVSPAMIERAISELEQDRSKIKNRKDKRDLGNLIGELDMVLSSPYEFSAKEAGMEIDEYEYSPNPSYTSAGWIITYVIVGGIVYYLWYKSKKDKEAAASATTSSSLYGVDPTAMFSLVE